VVVDELSAATVWSQLRSRARPMSVPFERRPIVHRAKYSLFCGPLQGISLGFFRVPTLRPRNPSFTSRVVDREASCGA
jgi:hypothetical protein